MEAAADSLVADLRNVFGDRLLAVVAYGPRDGGHGQRHSPVSRSSAAWPPTICRRARSSRGGGVGRNVATPLIMPSQEFMRSLDTFPLEYGEIIRTHELVYGDDPFTFGGDCAG